MMNPSSACSNPQENARISKVDTLSILYKTWFHKCETGENMAKPRDKKSSKIKWASPTHITQTCNV